MLTYLYALDYEKGDAFQTVAVAALQITDGHVANSSSKMAVVDDTLGSHCMQMNNVRVYVPAEKYNVPALKELAKTKFGNCCNYRLYRRSSTQYSGVLLTRIRVYETLSSRDVQRMRRRA